MPVTPVVSAESVDCDAADRLVSPQIVENHIHLEGAKTAREPGRGQTPAHRSRRSRCGVAAKPTDSTITRPFRRTPGQQPEVPHEGSSASPPVQDFLAFLGRGRARSVHLAVKCNACLLL